MPVSYDLVERCAAGEMPWSAWDGPVLAAEAAVASGRSVSDVPPHLDLDEMADGFERAAWLPPRLRRLARKPWHPFCGAGSRDFLRLLALARACRAEAATRRRT